MVWCSTSLWYINSQCTRGLYNGINLNTCLNLFLSLGGVVAGKFIVSNIIKRNLLTKLHVHYILILGINLIVRWWSSPLNILWDWWLLLYDIVEVFVLRIFLFEKVTSNKIPGVLSEYMKEEINTNFSNYLTEHSYINLFSFKK